ncbi:hypothetical protein LTR05_004382 [Lithohypha guttulata]|uniref:CAP-Gly domain-containing protein n=1 Tax=Lithohypha guttulata TaxID=1690604 RepID=A0AAN7YHL5_9EURO|nr:hypothetical protein LTR05_004382 [Lithohypha guttulata]
MAPLRVGDTVNVPGDMYGTVKFIGPVDGKKGTFAGVELAQEFASRGKNSGDVDGKHYFRTANPRGGIFLPVDKAEARLSGSSTTSNNNKPGTRATSVSGSPTTSAVSTTTRSTPRPSIIKPSFSQSVGPSLQQRTMSPTALKPSLRRDSLARPTSPARQQRPTSPLRKAQQPSQSQTPAAGRLTTPKTRPSIGLARSTMGVPATTAPKTGLRAPSHTNGGPNKFSQSLRQSTSQTPSRLRAAPSVQSSTTPFGPDDRFDEDDTILEQNEPETTPTPSARNIDREVAASTERLTQETQRLRDELLQRDKQLADQAKSIADMERSLSELQSLIDGQQNIPQDESDLPSDVHTLRAQLRENNEKVKQLSAEFDNNRADFRSTIDTLEMASTETERVYEQRVEDLLQQVQHLQERNEDVESVAQQFKQLEELVQELEEGLEESRRAEAEARSEVEFLRGEVERSKSELRREKERAATHAALEGGDNGGPTIEELEEIQTTLQQKEDEIRGLKTIIQSLQGTAPLHRDSYGPATPKANGVSHAKQKPAGKNSISDDSNSADVLQRQINDLESLLQQKSHHEVALQEEVRQLRNSVNLSGSKGYFPGGAAAALGLSLGHRRSDSQNEKHNSSGSQRTIVGQQTPGHQRKDSTIPDLSRDHDADNLRGRNSPLKDAFGIDTEGSEEANEERRRRSAGAYKKPQEAPSVSETSTAALWCEICEEPGHDILNCANMMGSSTHREPSPQPEFRTGKDAVREGLRRSNNNYLSEKPAPLRRSSTHDPPHPPPNAPLPAPPTSYANGNGTGSNRSSATPAGSAQTTSSTTATPTKYALIEGTGDQAGMIAGKTSGIIDPNRWCALCEKDGHESVDCPIEDAF